MLSSSPGEHLPKLNALSELAKSEVEAAPTTGVRSNSNAPFSANRSLNLAATHSLPGPITPTSVNEKTPIESFRDSFAKFNRASNHTFVRANSLHTSRLSDYYDLCHTDDEYNDNKDTYDPKLAEDNLVVTTTIPTLETIAKTLSTETKKTNIDIIKLSSTLVKLLTHYFEKMITEKSFSFEQTNVIYQQIYSLICRERVKTPYSYYAFKKAASLLEIYFLQFYKTWINQATTFNEIQAIYQNGTTTLFYQKTPTFHPVLQKITKQCILALELKQDVKVNDQKMLKKKRDFLSTPINSWCCGLFGTTSLDIFNKIHKNNEADLKIAIEKHNQENLKLDKKIAQIEMQIKESYRH